MEHAVMIDFGSTFTKVVLVDVKQREILLTDKFPSTVHTDARIALEQCFQAVKKVLPEEAFGKALKLSSSSAAGGLRMAVIGLTKSLSIAAGRAAVFGAGAKVMGTFHGALSKQQIEELEQLDLEIILLCGGYDSGNRNMILHNAKMLAASRIHVPVVYSGNGEAAREVRRFMAMYNKECFVIDNILPRVGELNVEPSQKLIRHLFMQRITNMKGLSGVKEQIGEVLMPTPAAVLAAGELLSQGTDKSRGFGDMMMVDVGGATTDVYSFNVNTAYEGASLAGVAEPFAKRTVEGDMGMRESSVCLYQEIEPGELAASARVTEEEFREGIDKRIQDTSFLAHSDKEARIEHAIACSAVGVSARRHAGKLSYTYCGNCDQVQHGKNLTEIRKVIGTGGAIVNSRCASQILKQVERIPGKDRDILLPKKVEAYIDREYVLFAAGLLRSYDEEAALAIMKKSVVKCDSSF